jgi:hypothetical protein
MDVVNIAKSVLKKSLQIEKFDSQSFFANANAEI